MTNSNQSHHTGGSYLRHHHSTSRQDFHSLWSAVKLGLTIAAILIIAVIVEMV